MEIIPAQSDDHLLAARNLFMECADALGVDLCFQGFQQELDRLPGDYAPPTGRLLLAIDGEQVVGCVAVRPLGDGICEVKRLYVRPGHRGKGLGRRLAEGVIAEATAIGYKQMRLDSLTSLNEAAVRRANLAATTRLAFGSAQLYSTASYQARDLGGIDLSFNEMLSWNFSQQDLAGANFTGSDLSRANLSGSNCQSASLVSTRLQEANLTSANLSHADLTGANLRAATLTGADLTDAVVGPTGLSYTTSRGFTASQLYSTASFKAKSLAGIGLAYNNMSDWDFSGQNLSPSSFHRAVLSGANFSQADLTRAAFTYATVAGADFTDAAVQNADFTLAVGLLATQLYATTSYKARNLTGINFSGNDLTGWDFARQDLTGAKLGSKLTGSDFTDAVVRGASFAGASPYGLTPAQLYSTASYKAKDLTGIWLSWNDLTGWDFAGQNLATANFGDSVLTGTNFTDAEVRGAYFGLSYYNPGPGIAAAQLYSTASYKAGRLAGTNFERNDLRGYSFAHQDLTGASFESATLASVNDDDRPGLTGDGADFTDAVVRGANFTDTTANGFTAAQLYSTTSYKAKELRGIVLKSNNLSGWNFAGQDLSGGSLGWSALDNVNLRHANLINTVFEESWATSIDLSGADARGDDELIMYLYSNAITTNTILPDGSIEGLNLQGGWTMLVRDDNGATYDYDTRDPRPIKVKHNMTMDASGTLRLVLEANPWDSVMSFEPGIPVALDGKLELTFAADVDVAGQIGRTFRLFDWSHVSPAGRFDVVSQYAWDVTDLYTTGEVVLVPEPATLALLACALLAVFVRSATARPSRGDA
jgi:uncharacterized protein YjbI with pentapeptide repeats